MAARFVDQGTRTVACHERALVRQKGDKSNNQGSLSSYWTYPLFSDTIHWTYPLFSVVLDSCDGWWHVRC